MNFNLFMIIFTSIQFLVICFLGWMLVRLNVLLLRLLYPKESRRISKNDILDKKATEELKNEINKVLTETSGPEGTEKSAKLLTQFINQI